jgi:ribonuclease HII
MKITAGVDEVGRGSLMGPVYAAAVILNKKIDKKLLKTPRLFLKIKENYYQNILKKTLSGLLAKHQLMR